MELIENRIYYVRGQRVMLDQDLAFLYEVETKALNRAIERNLERFPEDFSFCLSESEWKVLKCQIGTSKKGRGGKQKLPRLFTEQGAYGAAFMLRSPRAKLMSIEVIRAFIRMRNYLSAHGEMNKELKELKSYVLKNGQKVDQEFQRVWRTIQKLSAPPTENQRIGFRLD